MIQLVRTLWGNDGRKPKVNKDIQLQLKAKYQQPFVCLTYGKDNHKQLIDLGVNSVLICDEPRMFPKEQEFGHKVYTWLEASNRWNEYISLDWDVFQMKELPNNFNELIKGDLLVSLRIYFRKKIFWRKDNQRKIPCASFLKIGKPEVAQEIWRIWDLDLKRPWREELALAKFTEYPKNILDLNYYLANIEPKGLFCLKNHSPFNNDEINKDTLFWHKTGNKHD